MIKKFLFLLFLSTPAFASSDLIEIGISGLTDNNSEISLRQKLESFSETDVAEVDSSTNRAFLSLKEGKTISDQKIIRAVEESGFKVLDIIRSGERGIKVDQIRQQP